MTNVEIIAKAMKANGIEEPSHTFAAWKKLGYVVKKGEKAAFRLASGSTPRSRPRRAKSKTTCFSKRLTSSPLLK